ncbi:MAG: methionine--tRNA ligase, partial [Candidatus Nealsonbacteria bacterium]|nr:methionine--tRNA ligase [Candidatus Nealsonbacteria bacterium]
MKKKFYITTSIAYANALPHLGYALETIQADVLARHRRILGEDVFFLTGTDEHGRKVLEAASAAGKTPEDFTDEISGKFKELAKVLNLSNNDFIRTTDKKRHWPQAQEVWLKLKENGDIYKKKYKGLYCVGCEAFITKKDLVDGKCHIHQKTPEVIEEENYFFRLSKYSSKISDILKKDNIKIIPETRKNEMLSFAKQGLEDISFSRPRKDLTWGIPVPDDKTQTIYVWADALTNYLSGAPGRWPADVHCIGKDIQKFHCLIWPGMLLSLGLPLPKTILVHGFINVAGQKMSKSLGNVIDPVELVKRYGVDPVRYFLLREIPPTEDGDFTYEKFEQRYNSDLAKGIGNLVARVITLAKISNFQFPISNKFSNSNFQTIINKIKKECDRSLNKFKFNEALAVIWELIGWCDKYIEKEKPWVETKNQLSVISDLSYALSNIAQMLQPFLPETSEKIL